MISESDVEKVPLLEFPSLESLPRFGGGPGVG